MGNLLMDIVDEIIDKVEQGRTVSFSSAGSVYQIEPIGDEWMFSVDGGLICLCAYRGIVVGRHLPACYP